MKICYLKSAVSSTYIRAESHCCHQKDSPWYFVRCAWLTLRWSSLQEGGRSGPGLGAHHTAAGARTALHWLQPPRQRARTKWGWAAGELQSFRLHLSGEELFAKSSLFSVWDFTGGEVLVFSPATQQRLEQRWCRFPGESFLGPHSRLFSARSPCSGIALKGRSNSLAGYLNASCLRQLKAVNDHKQLVHGYSPPRNTLFLTS